MPPSSPSEPQVTSQVGRPVGHTTLQGTLARMRAKLGTHVLVVGGLCLGIALILTVIDGNSAPASPWSSACWVR
jgi:hypothetical protein